jgi:hypothetical protein
MERKEGLGKRKGEDVGRGKGKGRGCGEGQMERGDEGGRRGWGRSPEFQARMLATYCEIINDGAT